MNYSHVEYLNTVIEKEILFPFPILNLKGENNEKEKKE